MTNHIDLDELIAHLHEELGQIDQAILTLERMAVARAAYTGRCQPPHGRPARLSRPRPQDGGESLPPHGLMRGQFADTFDRHL